MESWIQRIFLVGSLGIFSATLLSTHVLAQSDATDDATILDAVINPDIKRRVIEEDKMDALDVEIGVFGGVNSVEDFGTNNIAGLRLAFHVTEDWFLEAGYGAVDTQESSYEILNGDSADLLTDAQRKLTYYNLSLGLNLLHGETFLGRKYAFNTNYYIIAGVGNTQFAGDEYFTTNFGAGFRLFATDWLALRVDFRHHLYSHTIFGNEKSVQNMEATLGASIYF